jgi:hypothetical protein
MTTEIEPRPTAVSLFNGATPDQITAAAADVATRFSDIVKRQRMFKRIGDRDHILIEAWQTIGTLTGVFATEAGGVRELPWPDINQMVWVADEPPPGDELHKKFEHHQTIIEAHTLGRSWGYAAAFRAVQNGREVGWGEGRVDRSERTWAGRDDYALASMAQTRGQSRALGAPLRFIVKLAGYEATSPDEMPQDAAHVVTDDAEWGRVVETDEELGKAVDLVHAIAPDVDAAKFIVDMAAYFNGIPEANLKMLRGLLRRIGETRSPENEATS